MKTAKAVVAFVGALAASLGAALADGRLTVAEIATAVLVSLGALGGTWAVPNKQPRKLTLPDSSDSRRP